MAHVIIEIHDAVAVVTLHDPERRNALTPGMVDEIVTAFDTLEDDASVGAVVVTGTPPSFCAGADLSHLGGSERDGLRHIYEGFLRIGRSPLPTVAAVNGAAVGAGMNLALVCDVRLAAASARFDTRFVQLGIHPGGGHTWMLQRAVGPQAARAMVLFGEILDGAAAERAGLVWRCVGDDELMEAAITMAGRAAAGPRKLVRRVKQTMELITSLDDHGDAVERELEPQVASMGEPEFRARLAALRQRINAD